MICTLLPQTEPQWGETGNCKCSSWNIMSRKRVIKSSDRAQWSRSIWKFSDKWRVRFFLPSLVTLWQTQRLNLPLLQAMSNSTLQEWLQHVISRFFPRDSFWRVVYSENSFWREFYAENSSTDFHLPRNFSTENTYLDTAYIQKNRCSFSKSFLLP